MEVYVDDETKLTLHGLQQHYEKVRESEKNKKLFELLDVLEFNQVCAHCCLQFPDEFTRCDCELCTLFIFWSRSEVKAF